MTGKKEDSLKTVRKELEILKDKNLLLEEQLQLQRTNWLYSHHLSFSICFGFIYGAIVSTLYYLIMFFMTLSPPLHGLVRDIFFGLSVILILGMPTIAILPPFVMLKAPSFVVNSFRSYLVMYFFSYGLIFYADPLNMFMPAYQGIERLNLVSAFALFQFVVMFFFILFAPQIAERCGHRLALSGSVFSFEVDANITAVSTQLNKIEEDFNLVLDRPLSGPNKLYFKKPHEKENIALQIFLRPREDKTDLVLVMHSIVNDVPMRTESGDVERIGKTLMKWLEVSKDFTVLGTENKSLINEIIQESKKSFYRHPVALPSKKVVKKFLKDHWKDIAIVTSSVVAVLSWLWPLK